MKTNLDCIPCLFAQALRAGRIATDDEAIIKRILDELGAGISSLSLDSTPPEIGQPLYRRIKELTGNSDPYRRLKEAATRQALDMYPELRRTVAQSTDPLLTAIRLAIAGNTIDLGVGATYDIEAAVADALRRDFAVCDYAAFVRQLHDCSEVLYIGDNAGETVFDRLLIEQLDKPVTYVVRDQPVINDATAEDACQAGLDQVATIISSGSDAPGVIPALCSPDVRSRLKRSPCTVAKGQGNYEGLSGSRYAVFFLLKAKCSLIATELGVQVGDLILKEMNNGDTANRP